jgi:hypothetical protein
MVGRPPPHPFSGDPFPPLPLPLSYRAALAAPLAGVFPPAGAPPGFAAPVAALSPAAGAPPGLAAPSATTSSASGAPPGLAAPPASFSPAIGALPGPLPPPATISSAVGAPLGTATSMADLPSAASEPPAVAAPPATHFPATPAVSGHARPFTAELQDIVRVSDDTAHRIWGALEAQFLGHRHTWILYLETAFRQLAQGDLSVDEYCRQMKTMADTLRTLGAPITDECLVLNLLRSLSPRFDRVTPILTRMKPFPTFAETKNDLLLEELRLSAHCDRRSRHDALQRSSGSPLCLWGILFTALWFPAVWSSSAAYWLQGGRGRGRDRGRKSGRDVRGHSPGGSQWPSFYNPWTGTI